jgi:hypothetical protein
MKSTVSTTRIVCFVAIAAIASIASFSNLALASDDPCGTQIAAFKRAINASAANPEAGPRARQTLEAQLSHQPTAAMVENQEVRARKNFVAELARAEAFSARGNTDACWRALMRAELMYDLR